MGTHPEVQSELRRGALAALCLSAPGAKCAAIAALAACDAIVDPDVTLSPPPGLPGRPPQPALVAPGAVAARSVGTRAGHRALLHALAHIEFNAINLALDAVWRFAGMPPAYYRDWLRVAAEEVRHFELLCDHLATLDCHYGALPAHDGLWQMAERTAADVLARMALVPRTLEARGLDASPAVRDKLAAAGDQAGAAIVELILRDEIGHVATGNRWFHWLCRARNCDPVLAYAELAARHGAPRLRGPFNFAARRAAGFLPEEIAALASAP